ncbi:MAG TPA: MarR family transcriptional regulator [Candidatus Saccharimonadales bacterium]|nr:MarR family transcriptional regulator [Candidatus Saccharimonadales bacterium]
MKREELIQGIVENLVRCQRPTLNGGWKDLGLSHAQMGMLFLLFHHNEASVKQISEYLGITKSAVSQLLDPLLSKKLISRDEDPKDRRVVRLNLTAKGSEIIKKVAKHKFDGIRTALDSLDDRDLRELYELHKKVAAAAA